jgi:type I restriction-modification system DNA methylase subunit
MQNLTWEQIETNAISFSKKWSNSRGDERQEAQKFEIDLLGVFGVDIHEGLHEYQVRDGQGRIGYIDYLLPGKILIEMKSKGESLVRAYNQGYDYCKCLKPEEYPELLLVSDFDYIQVTNLKTMQTFKKFKISQLKKHVRMLGVLAGYNSVVTFKTDIEVNIDASYKMAKLHDTLKENGYQGEDLEIYLVRILFCLFAEDTGIFEQKAFEQYIRNSNEDGSDLSGRIMMLFSVLNTPENKRMTNSPDELKKFRYINGKLFSRTLPPAYFDSKLRQILIDCCDFDWSFISPAIFGAMFQGVMNPKERRELGAHYTSEENILKLIKPLFLEKLWEEFEKSKSTKAELKRFHKKLSTINILDPACGCGNFLIITYRELRLLEFEVLKMLYDNRQLMIIETLCEISIEQFYGIEYEEFPCHIAQVSLLLMKHQLDKEVSNYFGMNIIDFPIRETPSIVHGNALRMDWEKVVSRNKLKYIIGNPPFIGFTYMSGEQKEDMKIVFEGMKNYKVLDYVTGWYKKASEYIASTNIRIAFVSTNSITQGEQVATLWNDLIFKNGVHIDFAYRTFNWTNEAKGKAKVHCVIIGFSSSMVKGDKIIYYEDGKAISAKNISPYLIDSPNILINSTNKPICDDIPSMVYGNKAVDGGNLIIEDKEYDAFTKKEPLAIPYIKKLIGAYEFINNKERYVLWLVNISPKELRKMPHVLNRIESVKKMRLESKDKGAQKLADTPTTFRDTNNPRQAIVIPRVSSERRSYVPMDFIDESIIVTDAVQLLPEATLYHFGVLTSNIHMAWLRAVAGRLKSDYRYSKDIVYNTFPWPNPTEKQIEIIIEKAQEVLAVRANYPESSLADLYDPVTMPTDLIKAHRNLDKAVYKSYGASWKGEEECVTELMKRYRKIAGTN